MLTHHLVGGEEPLFEFLDCLLLVLEARQVVLTEHHHFNENYYLVSVLLQGHEAVLHEVAEQSVVLAATSSEYVDELLSQFEGCLLEFQPFSWCIREQEAVVDVYNVTLLVEHYVLVVSVFYLQNVLYEGVGGQTVAKVFLCPLETFAFDFTFAVVHHEILEQSCVVTSFMDFIDAHGVIYDLDQPTVRTCCQDFIGLQPQWQLLDLEYLVYL